MHKKFKFEYEWKSNKESKWGGGRGVYVMRVKN
jgi:hypothetical protein